MVSDLKHGVYTTYIKKQCRCAQCRRAMAVYHLDYLRRNQAAIDPDDDRHGTDNFYTNHGCRCDACRAARATKRRLARRGWR